MQIRVKKREISSYGGINFVIDEINKAGIPQLIDSVLPKRRGGSKYKWSDAILGIILGRYCSAERLEDMEVFRSVVHNKSLNIPSSDQLGIILKRNLTTPNIIAKGKEDGKSMEHRINVNEPLNGLLLDIAVKLGMLKAGKGYVMDFDSHIIECDKFDATYNYQKTKGYQPSAAFIGQIPAYVEGRNGNAPAAFAQEDTLKRTLANLTERGIKIRRFRADAASYQKEVIDLMDVEGRDFFIRAVNSEDLYLGVTDIMDWEEVRLGNDFFEVGSFNYVPFKKENEKAYRVVTARRPADKPHHITGKYYVYRSIITNNRQLSDADVVYVYNMRGKSEQMWDVLNNDWSWRKLPFSFLSENTAFMLVTAIGATIFHYIVNLFASRADFIESSFRMKAFQFNAINVPAEWKGDVLHIYDTSRPWGKLLG